MRFLLPLCALFTIAASPIAGADEKMAARPTTVLLITAEELRQAWQPFADWKTKNGKSTKVITVEQIEKRYNGNSIQEKIRQCVRAHIDKTETRWVVLGGDCESGGGLVPGGHTTVHQQERKGIPTDIVYLSRSNWDADGDGKIGEWKDDQDAIEYPDGSVGLGRIPVRTAKDVEAFTAKVIEYESAYPENEFAKSMIYTCTDSPAYPKVRRSWDDHVSKAWDGGSAQRFFNQETPWDKPGHPGSFDLTSAHLVELINGKSTSKLHIHGHGHLPSWVLEKSQFTRRHVGELENRKAYPLITTVSCNTGEYDGKDPSIVEAMLRAPGAGSVAVVAPVRTGKPHFHKRSDFRLMVMEGKLDGTTMTMTRYWKNGLGEHALTTGQALMKAKSEMENDARKTAGYHLCICELNLLGDPTLDMRAKPARSAKIEATEKLATGKQRIEIKTDAPGATVCAWKKGENYAAAQADEDGNASFDLELRSAGELTITVSGASLNSSSKVIEVTKVERSD